MEKVNTNELNELTIAYLDIDDDSMQLTTVCGRKFCFMHMQECCEDVRIMSKSGDLLNILNKQLVSVEMAYLDGGEFIDPDNYDLGSATVSDLTFTTNDETECVRWLGRSNGYYGETVSLYEIVDTKDF